MIEEKTYVGSLDGLRAIAVAAVIVYHFAPSVLPAGFLGVDVFFVVSGFLITRLLIREIARTNTVGLANFWKRRARRLLPALATVTVVVLVAASIKLTNAEIHDIRAQALGTLFYCANWVIIFAKGSYFGLAGRTPFRHLVYPIPEHGGLGVHLTLDLAGRARFGPDVQWVDEPNYDVDPRRADRFYAAIREYWRALPDGALQPAYAGVRPKISGPTEPVADFRIDGPAVHGVPGLVHLFGIESPGLTASLALAGMVAREVS